MDHHQEQAHRLPSQRAALMRLERMRLQQHPTPTAERLRTAFWRTNTPEATSCSVHQVDVASKRRSMWNDFAVTSHAPPIRW
jgi:hypothetical protein